MSRVIFLHIPKTAGMALRAAFAKQVDPSVILPVPDDFRPTEVGYPVRPDTASMGYQITITDADVVGYELVMGHYDWRLVERLSDDWQVVTMLRHPVRQLVSLYNFYRATPKADRDGSHEVCNRLSFREWLDTEHCHLRLNQACQVLSGQRHGVFVDYEKAERNLERCAVVGIVDDMSASIDLINEATGWKVSKRLKRENASPVRAEDVKLDAETYKLAAWNQRYDMMLYDKVLRQSPPPETETLGNPLPLTPSPLHGEGEQDDDS